MVSGLQEVKKSMLHPTLVTTLPLEDAAKQHRIPFFVFVFTSSHLLKEPFDVGVINSFRTYKIIHSLDIDGKPWHGRWRVLDEDSALTPKDDYTARQSSHQ
jgi:hypothetical protein